MKQFTALFLLLAVVAGCRRHERVEVLDVTRPVTLTLAAPPEKLGVVNGLMLRINGRLDGKAQIWATDLQTNIVGKRFTIERNGSYARSNCIVQYVPSNVHSGRLTIRYRFD